MLKEAAIFVVSAGTLVYFLAPVGEDEKPQPEPAGQEQVVAVATETSEDDDWGYEDEGEDDDFAFGQSLLDSTGSDSAEEVGDPDENRPARSASRPSENYKRAVAAANRNAPRPVARTPKPGEIGSEENPRRLSPSVQRQ